MVITFFKNKCNISFLINIMRTVDEKLWDLLVDGNMDDLLVNSRILSWIYRWDTKFRYSDKANIPYSRSKVERDMGKKERYKNATVIYAVYVSSLGFTLHRISDQFFEASYRADHPRQSPMSSFFNSPTFIYLRETAYTSVYFHESKWFHLEVGLTVGYFRLMQWSKDKIHKPIVKASIPWLNLGRFLKIPLIFLTWDLNIIKKFIRGIVISVWYTKIN